MKNIKLLLPLLCVGLLTYSQNTFTPVKLIESAVPLKVKQAFESKFPNAQEIEWEKLDKEKATEISSYFSQKGKGMVATYNPDGILLELETELSVKEVPTLVIEKFKQKYGLPKDLSVVKVDVPQKSYTEYQFSFGKKEAFFTDQGIQVK